MSSAPPPREPGQPPRLTATRITTWVVVGGIGVFLLASGIIGMIAKG